MLQAEAKADEAQFLDVAGDGPVANDFVAVRIYAHDVRANRQPNERTDFTETLFWSAGLKTDENGKATVEFGLNDSVTSFRILADAFNANGHLGSASKQIDSVEPFYLEPKLPLEVTMGDIVRAPLGIVNATSQSISETKIRVIAHGSQQIETAVAPFALRPGERARRLLQIRVGKFNGEASLTLDADAGPYADNVTRKMMVRPLGFPVELTHGGLIAPGETLTHEIIVPDDLVKSSLQARVKVYPSPLATMTEALERLIQEPYGCFEQTSSTTYPLVMAQQYFMSHQGVDPALIERSAKTLDKGYERLIGFESPSGGFEWFGSDPGHDALTAYGLMEFTDMAQVRHVDPALLARTANWLVGQRDGKGGYQRKTHTLHTWLAEPEVAFPYNTWSLLSSGVSADLAAEVAWVREAAERTDNTYVMALAANVLGLGGDAEGANHMLDR
ncbi:MAG: A-macroglobulin complement component, partial [Rhodobacteraceae bacterium]|nr:A-macroglobulin complement component [Paracoccaceae bacterium]